MRFRGTGGKLAAVNLDLHRAGRAVIALVLAAIAMPVTAASVFVVTEPWVRVTPNARSAEAFMQLKSTEEARLVGVRSDVVADVTMRPPGATRATVSQIHLPAGVAVLLAPGAYRLALAALGHPLKPGDRVPLVLTIEAADGTRQEIPVSAEVRRRSPTDDHRRGHQH